MKNTNVILEIMPEDYYFDTLKPLMDDMYMNCRYDGELTRTLEKLTNDANQYAVTKDYEKLGESFDVILKVITDKGYQKSNLYVRASQEEKNMVQEFNKSVQELLMIIKCTKSEPIIDKLETRQRIGYNSLTGANEILKSETPKQERSRIPNL